MSADVLGELDAILEQRRRTADPKRSYTASLYAAGLDAILRKLGEESVETLLAAKQAERDPALKESLASEVADMWFHSLVMLSFLDMKSDTVTDQLKQRLNRSGLEEKAARNTKR